METRLVDKFGRGHDYLRISVTDRCNLRCVYCMGPEGVKLLDHTQILSYEEIIKVVEAGAEMGISKIRLTGGEPLVRLGLENLVAGLAAIPGIHDISLTTNGLLLAEKAATLKKAGLKRVNISLDTLRPQTYREITRGGDLNQALAGIRAARDNDLTPVKINVVLMKGVNDVEIEDFLRLIIKEPLNLRFIEYMPLDGHDGNWDSKYLSLQMVKETAAKMGFPLKPLTETGCHGPAEIYSLPGTLGTVGLIHPISKHFCSSCNRLRLTADGYLKPCLYWQEELPVRPVIHDKRALQALLVKALSYKKERHAMQPVNGTETRQEIRSMSKIGG